MAEVRAIEHSTLKIPYEVLNKKYRATQKVIDKEFSQVQSASSELEKGLSLRTASAGDITRLLGNVADRLQVMKRKAHESLCEETSAGNVVKRRLEHLKENTASPGQQATDFDSAAIRQWKMVRFNRLVVEHFLRLGYYDSAECLANRTGIQDLTNLEIFQTAKEVEQDLAKRATTKLYNWCADNRTKLRKINSNIEFLMRVQEFVELIKKDKRLDAVRHARKFFPPFSQDQLKEIGHCMALLAFPVDTEEKPYKNYFAEERWNDLILSFRMENFRLFQLTPLSMFGVTVQVGLSALKTPQCYADKTKVSSCPVCCPGFNELADKLPFAHCAQSRLICRITGMPLNEHNLPMMLPNCQVYGEHGILQITNEDGVVVCPKTKLAFSQPKVEKVYVM